MTIFASVSQVKQRVRFDHDLEDADWLLALEGATAAILTYLRDTTLYQDSNGDVLVDSSGDVVPASRANPLGVPSQVMNATMLLAGMMKRDPDGQDMSEWEQGYLPWQVTAMIYMLRCPAMG